MKEKKKFERYIFALLIVAAVGYAVVMLSHTSEKASAFGGPSNGAGVGSGAVAADASNNLGIGVAPNASVKFLLQAPNANPASYAFSVTGPSGNPYFTVSNSGAVAMPGYQMPAGNVISGQFGQNTGGGNFSFPASVGIGTPNPGQILDVSGGNVRLSQSTIDGSTGGIQFWSNTFTNEAGAIKLPQTGGGNSMVFYTKKGGVSTEAMRITDAGNVGIGTANPGSALSVVSATNGVRANYWIDMNGSACGLGGIGQNVYLNQSDNTYRWANTHGSIGGSLMQMGACSGASYNDIIFLRATGSTGNIPTTADAVANMTESMRITSAGTLVVGGGSGKITAGTIDPAYTINGEKFATYVPGMTGQKEETAGVATLTHMANGTWQTTIDFDGAPKGSDLWLFRKAIGDNFGNISVLLTPSFDGIVWYEKNATNGQIIIHASTSNLEPSTSNLEISYRLTAPRFDSAKWSNTRSDDAAGLIINN